MTNSDHKTQLWPKSVNLRQNTCKYDVLWQSDFCAGWAPLDTDWWQNDYKIWVTNQGMWSYTDRIEDCTIWKWQAGNQKTNLATDKRNFDITEIKVHYKHCLWIRVVGKNWQYFYIINVMHDDNPISVLAEPHKTQCEENMTTKFEWQTKECETELEERL
jgi:hypothetical protein